MTTSQPWVEFSTTLHCLAGRGQVGGRKGACRGTGRGQVGGR